MSSVDTITPTEPSVSYQWAHRRNFGQPNESKERLGRRKITHSHDVQEEAAHVMAMSLAGVPTPVNV
jgi:hypothetical protein